MFFSTMAMDDMMFDLAKTRALEDQCYVGMDFVGNAAIIEPVFVIRKGMKTSNQNKSPATHHRGRIHPDGMDIECVRKIKKRWQLCGKLRLLRLSTLGYLTMDRWLREHLE